MLNLTVVYIKVKGTNLCQKTKKNYKEKNRKPTEGKFFCFAVFDLCALYAQTKFCLNAAAVI